MPDHDNVANKILDVAPADELDRFFVQGEITILDVHQLFTKLIRKVCATF